MCVCLRRGADDAAVCDGMEQAAGEHGVDCLDCVITNILVVDYTGIYKCDLGVCVYLKRRVP
jgi:urease alpha subunit